MGAAVHVYSPEEYSKMKLFVTEDGKAGVAVKSDGDIVSVFKTPGGPQGIAFSALQLAVQNGGTKLDAFDTVLPILYAKAGFAPVARLKWDDSQAPAGWSKETFKKFNNGEPDVVFMAHDASRNIFTGYKTPYVPGEGKRVGSYDEGAALLDEAVKKFASKKKSDQLSGVFKSSLPLSWRGVKYDSDQPRVPAGETGGGQWAAAAGGAQYDKEKGWVNPDKPLSDADQARLKALRVPPAWRDVHLNPDPHGALQAVGKDSKDRRQYLYSKEHSERAASEKFSRLKEFNDKVPALRAQATQDMQDEKLPKEARDTAAVVHLIAATGFRIGSEADTKTKHTAYGASTLLGHHVKMEGDKLAFSFVAKKGVRINKTLTDPVLGAYFKNHPPTKGEPLFQTNAALVRDYFHKIAGNDFNVKDLRTWQGTAKAIEKASKLRPPKDEKSFKKWRREIAVTVSKHLGNTPAVALSAYIDPAVFKPWSEKWEARKADSLDDMQWLMDGYFETHHYDVASEWRGVPETTFDPAVFKPWSEKWVAKKADTPEDMQQVMDEYFQTHSYDDEGDWRSTPETGFDPDDDSGWDLVQKFNPYHDEGGRFATASDGVALGEDMKLQVEWLERKARSFGYQSLAEMERVNPEAFLELAGIWRGTHVIRKYDLDQLSDVFKSSLLLSWRGVKFDPDQARDESGKWTGGGPAGDKLVGDRYGGKLGPEVIPDTASRIPYHEVSVADEKVSELIYNRYKMGLLGGEDGVLSLDDDSIRVSQTTVIKDKIKNLVGTPNLSFLLDQLHKQEPVLVVRVGDRQVVVDGHSRLVAAKQSGLKSIPVKFIVKGGVQKYDPDQARDENGKWTGGVPGSHGDLPPEAGTVKIPEGMVRLYHQTNEENLASIASEGLNLAHAKGIEGPKAVYAGENPFYGKVETTPTVEFFVPKDKWSSPFVLQDVPPENIVAVHFPWHRHARYLDNPEDIKRALAGEFDFLLQDDSDEAKGVRYIKDKYGKKAAVALQNKAVKKITAKKSESVFGEVFKPSILLSWRSKAGFNPDQLREGGRWIAGGGGGGAGEKKVPVGEDSGESKSTRGLGSGFVRDEKTGKDKVPFKQTKSLPEKGDRFLVFRTAGESSKGLEGKNAGDSVGAADFLSSATDIESPVGGRNPLDAIHAYEVVLTADATRSYVATETTDDLKKEPVAVGMRTQYGGRSFYFPKGGAGYTYKKVASLTLKKGIGKKILDDVGSFVTGDIYEAAASIEKAFAALLPKGKYAVLKMVYDPGFGEVFKSSLLLSWRKKVEKGDLPGHEFHGNQYTDVAVSESGRDGYLDTVSRMAREVRKELGVVGVNITVVDKEPPSFKVGNMMFSEGGHYSPGDFEPGEIEINARNITSETAARGIVAHELTHHVWNTLEKMQESEHSAISSMPKEEYARFFMGNGYARPERLQELQQRYPVSAMFSKYLGDAYVEVEPATHAGMMEKTNRLEKDDGVTAYSKAYWDADPRHVTNGFKRAVDETLAEISFIYSGTAGDLTARNGVKSKLWQEFHADLMQTYQKTKKGT